MADVNLKQIKSVKPPEKSSSDSGWIIEVTYWFKEKEDAIKEYEKMEKEAKGKGYNP